MRDPPPLVRGALLPGRRLRNPAEQRALWFYRLRGYRILATNVWAGRHELDIVARRGAQLVFCEVKSKRGDGRGDPLEMVGFEKRRRLRLAAETFLASRPELADLECSFEVVAIRGAQLERVLEAF